MSWCPCGAGFGFLGCSLCGLTDCFRGSCTALLWIHNEGKPSTLSPKPRMEFGFRLASLFLEGSSQPEGEKPKPKVEALVFRA